MELHARKTKNVQLNADEDGDEELTELYKMLSVIHSKTKELESNLQGMIDSMGKMEKQIAAQTQMMQVPTQQMEVTNKAVQDAAAKHVVMMTMMASIQQSVVQLAQSDPEDTNILKT